MRSLIKKGEKFGSNIKLVLKNHFDSKISENYSV